MKDYEIKLAGLRQKCIARGCSDITGRFVEKAKGSTVVDILGREYIDFVGGIGVMNVGHSHPKVVEAIKKQAENFTHTCLMITPYSAAVLLAEKLCEAMAGESEKTAFFANSGAEAVENAIKMARFYTKRPAVIAFEHAFHGRTMLASTLTSKVRPLKIGFGPQATDIYRMPFAYCYRCPYNKKYPECGLECADHLEDFLVTHVAPESVAAVIVEPVPGEGGFLVPPLDFFKRIKEICEKHGILFIADEIQTGFGRTGKLFAMEHFNVEADMAITAKSLAAGMPLSAVVGKKEIMDHVPPGGLGGTYGGNPVACAAALAVFDIFGSEGLLAKAVKTGNIIQARLYDFMAEFDFIGDVRGIGPMQAFELVKNRETKEPYPEAAKKLTSFCLENGLILLSCGAYANVIRFLAPLTTPEDQLKKGLDIIGKGLKALTK